MNAARRGFSVIEVLVAIVLAATVLVAAVTATLLVAGCLVREQALASNVRKPGFVQRHALLFVYLPLLVPQTAFLFGLQILFILGRLDGTLAALVLAHLVFVLPYVFLSLSDPWRAMDRRYDAAAAGLGLSPRAALFKVRLPMLSRAILAAAALGFAVSASQYLATVLIGGGRLATITTEAVALASGGNRRLIGVYALVQMVLPALVFAIAIAAPALYFRNRNDMRV